MCVKRDCINTQQISILGFLLSASKWAKINNETGELKKETTEDK